MIEETIYRFLTRKFDIPVKLSRPEKMPQKLIIFEKTGSTERNFCKSSTIAIQSYAGTITETAGLNEAVKEAMRDLIEEPDIVSVKLNSDYHYTDTAEKRERYQAVYNITHY